MTTAAPPAPRTRRKPRPLAALIDEVLRRADADLSQEEAVHDLRVACRRLEAGTRVNAGVLRRARLRDTRDAAKTIRRSFDQARDLEVIAAELGGVPDLSPAFRTAVRAAAEEHTSGARQRGRVTDALGTLTKVRSTLDAGAVPDRAVLATALGEHTNALFDELDRLLPESSDDALHEARISTKKLRYEVEIAASALPRLRTQVKRLKRLQDIVGRHQDAAVGLAWAEGLTEGAMNATTDDRAVLMRYYAGLRREQRTHLRRLLTAWRTRDMRGRFLKAIGPSAPTPGLSPTA